ncbi:hypothetical protein LCGC14_2816600 [marine sediment metagenome]|uniref:SprT-like domain-containing protein n=1 Tax=marine sediment metagenome TaxID=412755 RepID=A0A0F9ARN7_9ZZZZ
MKLNEAKQLARDQIKKYGLNTWRFKWSMHIYEFGTCKHRKKVIKLSKRLVLANTRERILKTIRHEISHALLGYEHRHNNIWESFNKQLGGGKEFWSEDDIDGTQPAKKGSFWSLFILYMRF